MLSNESYFHIWDESSILVVFSLIHEQLIQFRILLTCIQFVCVSNNNRLRNKGGGDTHLGYGILGGKKSGIWDMRAKKSGIWDMGKSSGIWDIGVESINF